MCKLLGLAEWGLSGKRPVRKPRLKKCQPLYLMPSSWVHNASSALVPSGISKVATGTLDRAASSGHTDTFRLLSHTGLGPGNFVEAFSSHKT